MTIITIMTMKMTITIIMITYAQGLPNYIFLLIYLRAQRALKSLMNNFCFVFAACLVWPVDDSYVWY